MKMLLLSIKGAVVGAALSLIAPIGTANATEGCSCVHYELEGKVGTAQCGEGGSEASYCASGCFFCTVRCS